MEGDKNNELDNLWNRVYWDADPVHLPDYDPAVQKSGVVDTQTGK